jgi:hypothetical protein
VPEVTLRDTLETLAKDTWERLRDTKAHRMRFGEEAITDLNMLEIERQALPSIVVEQTSKRFESQSGTDFEMWLGTDRIGWVRLAVQAKKLHLTTENYLGLEYKVAQSHTLQIDLLDRYAQANDATPLNCLYNYTSNPSPLDHWHCCQGQGSFHRYQLGCTITPSSIIRETITLHRRKTFHGIHRAGCTLPWRCLTCPELSQMYEPRDRRPSQAPSDVLARLFGNELPRIHPKLPEALAQARDRRQRKALDQDGLGDTSIWSIPLSPLGPSNARDDWEFDRELYDRTVGFPRRRFILELDL